MLDCKLCNYYHEFDGQKNDGREAAICGFTGISFIGDTDKLDMEYPCRNINFNEYLERQIPMQPSASLYQLQNDDWRLIYRKGRAPQMLRRKA